MAQYSNPPAMGLPPSRESFGVNERNFRLKINEYFDGIYNFWSWLTGFIPWAESIKNQTNNASVAAINARDRAQSAESNAVGAWKNIQGHTIPSGAAYSLEQMEELVEAIILADIQNIKIVKE